MLINIKKHYMIIVPVILFISMLVYGFVNNSDEKGYMSVHMAYSKFLNAGVFPEPLDDVISEILKDNDRIRLSEFLDINTAIKKHCLKDDFSWLGNFISLIPARAFSIINPAALGFFNSPEVLIINQIELANSCEFKEQKTEVEDAINPPTTMTTEK